MPCFELCDSPALLQMQMHVFTVFLNCIFLIRFSLRNDMEDSYLDVGGIICSFNLALMFNLIKFCNGRYMFGLSAADVGLLILLDKGSRTRQWRCLMSTQVWNHQSNSQYLFEANAHIVSMKWILATSLPWFVVFF